MAETTMAPFDRAEQYRAAGWTGTLPLPAGRKWPPPPGYTGHDGRWPTPDDLTRWRRHGYQTRDQETGELVSHDAGNVALRLPPAVVGLDVDHYDGKRGGDTLAALVAAQGPLPPTWRSTSRADDVCGIRLYRVPPGIDAWPSVAGPDIEVIRHAHRYVVAAPSVHPDTGRAYRWRHDDGRVSDDPPPIAELPELPAAWLAHLTGTGNGAAGSRQRRREDQRPAREWLSQLDRGEPCRYVGRLAADARGAARREDGDAYDNTRDAVLPLLRAAERGHPGAGAVLQGIQETYVATVADKRSRAEAEGEFDRFTVGAAVLVLADQTPELQRGCDCGDDLAGLVDREPPADPDAAFLAESERAAEFARDVAHEAHRIRVREAARQQVADERLGEAAPFDADLLGAILTRPPSPPMRADGLVPSDAGTLVVAQRKVGKTTFEVNYARCLTTGEDFLGRFPVRPIAGNVALLNYEVGAAQLARWADEHGVPRDRLFLVNLRGRRNPLRHPDHRAALVKVLRDVDTEALIVDPFGRAYTGQSQNDAGEVGAWLTDLDLFARDEVGATDLVLSVHAGWDGERSRGSTALEDWADVIVTLTKDEDGARYVRALGRDVEVDEDALGHDPATRRLTLTGHGSRKAAKYVRAVVEARSRILDYLAGNPSASGRNIRDEVSGDNRAIDQARRELVDAGQVIEEKRGGRGGGKGYRLPDPDLFDDEEEDHDA